MMYSPILVTYATRYGATEETAAFIADVLKRRGERVELKPMRAVTDVTPYGAVVLGSAIRMAAWLPEAAAFVQRFEADLRILPTALFTVCITLVQDTPANREIVRGYLKPIHERVQPTAEAYFAGRIDPAQMGLKDRLLTKMVKAPHGVFRDWKAVRAWAETLFVAEPERA